MIPTPDPEIPPVPACPGREWVQPLLAAADRMIDRIDAVLATASIGGESR